MNNEILNSKSEQVYVRGASEGLEASEQTRKIVVLNGDALDMRMRAHKIKGLDMKVNAAIKM